MQQEWRFAFEDLHVLLLPFTTYEFLAKIRRCSKDLYKVYGQSFFFHVCNNALDCVRFRTLLSRMLYTHSNTYVTQIMLHPMAKKFLCSKRVPYPAQGVPPPHMAVVADNITGLQILCQYLQSAILSVCDYENNTALHLAAGIPGKVMEIMLQATDCRLSLRVQNLYGEIPLHFACACSQLANTQLLLNFDPNSSWNFNPKRMGNAAHICAWHGSILCLMEVMKNSGNNILLSRCVSGWTPLTIAARTGNVAIFCCVMDELCKTAGFNFFVCDISAMGYNCLHMAVMHRQEDICREIMHRCPAYIVHVPNRFGHSALHMAKEMNLHNIEFMLRHKARESNHVTCRMEEMSA